MNTATTSKPRAGYQWRSTVGRKRSAPAPSLAAAPWDDPTPTPERRAKGGVRRTASGQWIAATLPVDLLLEARHISTQRHQAATLYAEIRQGARDLRSEGNRPRSCIDFGRGGGEMSPERVQSILDAERRIERTLERHTRATLDAFLVDPDRLAWAIAKRWADKGPEALAVNAALSEAMALFGLEEEKSG